MTEIKKDVQIAIRGDVSDFKSKVDQAGQKAREFGDKGKAAGDKAKAGMDKAAAGAEKSKVAFGVAAIAIQGFTSQLAGLGQQVLDFDTKILAVQKTALGLEGQQLALKRQTEDLNKAVAEGTITERDYQRALEDIQLAYKNMVLEEKVVAAETKKLDGEFVTFGINAVGSLSQVAVAIAAVGAAKLWAGITTGIKLVGSGLWTLAKHPVFLIITAGILAWELALKNIVQDLTGIADLGIFSNLQKTFEGLTMGPGSMEDLDHQTQAYSNTIEQNLPVWGSQAEALDNVADSASNATEEIRKLTKAEEAIIRNSGFRTGPGKPLSRAINEEAGRIEAATARTLAAASLHEALKVAGISGSLFGRNISGNLTMTLESMQKAGRTKNSFYNSSQVIGGMTGGVSMGNFGGFGGLTRSSMRRRSGRDRNPRGRRDKLSEIFRSRTQEMIDRNNGLFEFTGVNAFDNPGRRFRTNSSLNRSERRAILMNDFAISQGQHLAEANRRMNNFRSTFTGAAGAFEQFGLLAAFDSTKFDAFESDFKYKNRIQTIIQARNFFRGKDVDFDGMSKQGLSGLLNIKEYGFREMNEQLAFNGETQFQSIGT